MRAQIVATRFGIRLDYFAPGESAPLYSRYLPIHVGDGPLDSRSLVVLAMFAFLFLVLILNVL